MPELPLRSSASQGVKPAPRAAALAAALQTDQLAPAAARPPHQWAPANAQARPVAALAAASAPAGDPDHADDFDCAARAVALPFPVAIAGSPRSACLRRDAAAAAALAGVAQTGVRRPDVPCRVAVHAAHGAAGNRDPPAARVPHDAPGGRRGARRDRAGADAAPRDPLDSHARLPDARGPAPAGAQARPARFPETPACEVTSIRKCAPESLALLGRGLGQGPG